MAERDHVTWEPANGRGRTGRHQGPECDVTAPAAIRELADTDEGRRTKSLGKIRSFHLSLVHICHVLASFAVVSFRSSFLAASELLSGLLRVFLRVLLASKMAADDTNSNPAVENINNLNTRKNFVCGVVEGEKLNINT